MSHQYPIAVTGVAGQLGRQVIKYLLDNLQVPAQHIVALTRDTTKLVEVAAQGVEVRHADFDNTTTLADAFKGVQRLLLISTDTLGLPGKRLEQHKNAIAAAEQAGVKHVIYTSMPKPEGSAITFAGDHLGTEQALAASNMSWTILRNNWYFENLFMETEHILASGQWFSAAGDGRSAHIARADLALAAAHALASGDTTNKTYTLSGAKAYRTQDMAELLSKVSGKPIAVVPITDEQKQADLTQAGLPPALAEIFASFDINTRQGGVAEVTDHFKQLTGKEPTPFEQWLDAHKNLFAVA
ncbi:SDR family oxidoreductase [Salinispirillum marinum]|uniref:SDR family oxidoreductase n=2 Tax=Saccharospirillaceae TaxID=255527 RepID=A0ABV8BBD5_9GAMM